MSRISDGVIRRRLDNGLTVLIKESHSSPVVAIVTYVKAGYFDESDDVVGVSHLMEHMFFKGTRRRGPGAIARETRALGGYLNASTIYDNTLYYTVLPSGGFTQGLDIQSDALINSAFDPEQLQKETEVVIEEAKRKLDTPTAVCREELFGLAFQKHRMRRWRIGTEEGLRALTRDDFLEFHKSYYRPQNIILSIVGDIDAKVARREVKRYYGGFGKGKVQRDASPVEPEQTEFRYGHMQGDVNRGHMAMAFHAPALFREDSYAMEILAFVLGQGRSSRLTQKVREQRSLVNSVSAYNYTLSELGVFVIEAVAAPDKLRSAELAIVEEIDRLRREPVTVEELEKARNLLESSYAFSQQSVSGRARILAAYEAYGDYHLIEDYLDKLQAVTQEDIQAAARKYLRPDNFSLFEYGPETLEKANEAFKRDLLSAFSDSPAQFQPATRAQTSAAPFSVNLPSSGKDGDMTRLTLENGATVLLKESHQAPLVSLGIFVPGGRPDETASNAGISNLMARTAMKGTAHRSAEKLANDIERLGASIHLSSEPDYFGCSMNILSKHLKSGWEIMTDVLTAPAFAQEELAKEREQALAQIIRQRDDMFRYPLQLFYSEIFSGHPYGLPALGTPESVAEITPDALRAWHGKHFRAGEVVISVVGDVNPDQLLDMLNGGLAQLNPENRTKRPPSSADNLEKSGRAWRRLQQPATTAEEREKEQTALVLGFPGPRFVDRHYYALSILQNVLSGLGGKLFEELRSRQSLAYTVSSHLVARKQGGAFLSYIATSPEKEQQARDGLLHQFENLATDPIEQLDLEQSIQYTVGTHQISLETLAAQMHQYAHSEILGRGFEEVDRLPEHLRQVSVDDILAAAREYFDTGAYAQGIVRGKKKA